MEWSVGPYGELTLSHQKPCRKQSFWAVFVQNLKEIDENEAVKISGCQPLGNANFIPQNGCFQRPNWSLSPKSCYIEQNETTTNHAQTMLISAISNSTNLNLGNPNALGEPPQGFCCLWWWDAKTRQRPRRPLRRSQIAACAHGGTIGFSWRVAALTGESTCDMWNANNWLRGRALELKICGLPFWMEKL